MSNPNPNESLRTSALLVALRISTWTAKKFDKSVTKAVVQNHGASADSGRFNKNLLPGEPLSYKALMSHMSGLRARHYQQTLAWADEGSRLLPYANNNEYRDMITDIAADDRPAQERSGNLGRERFARAAHADKHERANGQVDIGSHREHFILEVFAEIAEATELIDGHGFRYFEIARLPDQLHLLFGHALRVEHGSIERQSDGALSFGQRQTGSSVKDCRARLGTDRRPSFPHAYIE